ncbi:MAG: hypothetical protein LBP95_00780 [Deltaproteobacteria bacterium]|nr:hypothetical protein [Deltaproteobacteria bacterium]
MEPPERLTCLAEMADDAWTPAATAASDESVSCLGATPVLPKLLADQCDVVPLADGVPPKAVPKDPKDVSPDSLQSPFDVAATCCGAKRKRGCRLQVAETCSPVRRSDLDDPKPNLVVRAAVEGARASDAHAVQGLAGSLEGLWEELEGKTGGKARAEVCLADNARHDSENAALAESKGIDLIRPANNGRLTVPPRDGVPENDVRFGLAGFKPDGRRNRDGMPARSEA